MGERDTEDGPKDKGSLPRTEGKRDIEGKDETHDIGSVVGPRECPGFGSPSRKFVRLVMVFPVLIGQFELRTPCLYQFPFLFIELARLSSPVLTVVVAAFVVGNFLFLFPDKQGVKAIGAVVLALFLEPFFSLEEFATDLTQKLAPFLPIVIVEVSMGSMAAGTRHEIGHAGRADSILYWG